MEPQSSTPGPNLFTGHPRACGTCARAKAKCVSGDDGKCQRCRRLNKDCEPSHAQPRSQPRKRKATSSSHAPKSHVEKLEEKLDGLVTLLKSTHQPTATHESSPPVLLNTSSTSSTAVPSSNPFFESFHQGLPEQGWVHSGLGNGGACFPTQASQAPNQRPVTPNTTPISIYYPDPIIAENIEFSADEANGLLNRFRDHMAPFLPFLVVPPTLSAEDLNRNRPFLLKSILAVASRVPSQRLAIGKWLVMQLSTRMAVNGERSLDLLLGVLTYTGWCFYNCYNIPQLTILLSLGMALIFDLGLNRPPPSDSSGKSFFELAIRETRNPGSPSPHLHIKSSRTIEERRTFLGMFFLISSASKFHRSKIDSPRITPYVYECLESLEKAQDHPNDISATSLVRLQLIVERISQGPWNTDFGVPEISSSGPPLMFYVKSLQEQLKIFRRAMPPEVNLRGYILIHYYYAEETLYEVGLSRSPVMDQLPSNDFHRLELLHACLRSTKLFFETFLNIPPNKYPCISLATWTQITHSILVLQSLSNFDHPDWNLVSVRQEIDFVTVLDNLIERINQVEGQIFARAATKMAGFKAYIQEKMAADAEASRLDSLSGDNALLGRTWEPVDFLDEAWFGDLSGPMGF